MMIEQQSQRSASPTSAALHYSGEEMIMTTYTQSEHACRIAEHSHCPNAAYPWHRIDGYCKECATPHDLTETDADITARRNAQGYR